MMIHFECDYNEGAHPALLKALVETNMEQCCGYAEDGHCRNAARLIRDFCDAPDADVHFMIGGTPSNMITITAALRPHQAVVCADTGHINVHESGAIEGAGHKVIPVPGIDGKLTASQVRTVVDEHYDDETHEHMAQPAMVYISQPTELGTLYSLSELEEISSVCRKKGLLLYVDGARLGYALASDGNDVSGADLARLADAFYIGGTKVGALFGEALVLCNERLKRDFRYIQKQRGGMLAKGRLLGVQFEALFTDNLYLKISRHAVDMAMRLKKAFADKGWTFLVDSPTNQQFPIIPCRVLEKLDRKYVYAPSIMMDDEHRAVRFCTSWATTEKNLNELISDIESL